MVKNQRKAIGSRRKKVDALSGSQRQIVVSSDPSIKRVTVRKRKPSKLVQRPLIENSVYKLADLQGVKEEWSDRLLLPVVNRSVRPGSTAVSYKPTDNVMGVGIGEKYVAGRPTGVLAIKFLVRSKKDRNLVLSKHLLPTKIRGLPVDVEQVGTFRASDTVLNPKVEVRPAQPGCSVGFEPPSNGFAEAGTFGALVKRGGATFILSNNHVLADENNLSPGAVIYQPAILDDDNFENHQIATLTAYAKLLHDAPNTIDCAIAEVTDGSLVSNSILHIGTPTGTTAPAIGMPVHKFGRSSGYTVGSVSLVDTNVRLEYDTDIFLFKHQIIIESSTDEPFSEKGDSGALVVERGTQRAVGLLIGRDSDGTSGVANHITDVLQALNVALA